MNKIKIALIFVAIVLFSACVYVFVDGAHVQATHYWNVQAICATGIPGTIAQIYSYDYGPTVIVQPDGKILSGGREGDYANQNGFHIGDRVAAKWTNTSVYSIPEAMLTDSLWDWKVVSPYFNQSTHSIRLNESNIRYVSYFEACFDIGNITAYKA